jgi:3-dehydroquinate dehydratase-2
MTQHVLILLGPNLNLLGTRDPGLYGSLTMQQIHTEVQRLTEGLGVTVALQQSNSEGELINVLQEASRSCSGVVFNPGALSHYSYALHDAIKDAQCPVVEVHFSNIHAREEFRHTSVTAPACKGVIAGLGWYGLVLGIQALVKSAAQQKEG